MDFHPGGDLLTVMERNEGGMSEGDARWGPIQIHLCAAAVNVGIWLKQGRINSKGHAYTHTQIHRAKKSRRALCPSGINLALCVCVCTTLFVCVQLSLI